jgi:hypothetical protein
MNNPQGRLAEIWKTLSEKQKQWILAYQTAGSKKAAAEAVGIRPQTAYSWGPEVDEACALYVDHAAEAALAELTQALAKAALGKVQEMDSTDQVIAARARTEILDRGLGKPTQRQEVEVDGRFDVTSDRLDELTDELAARASGFADTVEDDE